MEPLFFKAENDPGGNPRAPRRGASMEPLFFKAENSVRPPCPPAGFYWSFNGAAFFQSGKSIIDRYHEASNAAASMEPLFFKAENEAQDFTYARALASFNGAAFFQSGKSPGCWRAGVYLCGFNGAAFFQSGKCPSCYPARSRTGRASMEPLFFKAENLHELRRVLQYSRGASMEPLFFKAENKTWGTLTLW